MLKRKKIAKLRRLRAAALLLNQERKFLKEVNRIKCEQAKRRKDLKEWRKRDHLRKYREAFGDCKVHEPRESWAEGPTTKSRTVLENY